MVSELTNEAIIMDLSDTLFTEFYEEPKLINGDLTWAKSGNGRYDIKDVDIISNVFSENDVKLYCRYNIFNDFAFTVVCYGKEKNIIIRYDKKIHPLSYREPCEGLKVIEPHKHLFKTGCPNGRVKIIPDSEIDSKNVNDALFHFFDECNIVLDGGYEKLKPIYQTNVYAYSDGDT